MGEVKLTPSQQAVVDHRGSSLLVSAAAGSGKTKVLVDRLLSMVCDPVQPKNLDEFLIITYTRPAAAELRGKIAAALSEKLTRDPSNRHLQRQMSRLYLTQISTVHAFCTKLLRTYAHELDIPSDFRVAEEMECAPLQQRCLEKVLEESYAGFQDHPMQRVFIDTLALERDDRKAPELILQMNKSAQCHPEPDRWLENGLRDALAGRSTPPFQTAWGSVMLQNAKTQLALVRRQIGAAIALCQTQDILKKQYLPAIEADMALTEQLLQETAWDDICAALQRPAEKLGRIPAKNAVPEQQDVKALRECYRGKLKNLAKLFHSREAEVMAQQERTGRSIAGLLELTLAYRRQYQTEKRRRRILDFSDLEQETIRLLVQRGTKQPTAIAREVSQRYCEVMVDEYQDTNEVQDLIFQAVSRKGRNLFLVGDVKQSIYRFRLADPTIFLEKYRTFAEKAQAEPGAPCKILLSENFRSDEAILDAANCVFAANMSQAVGGLRYGPAEALRAGIPRPRQAEPAVELYCIETKTASNEDETKKTEVEAAFVAQRIAQLLQEPMMIPDKDGLRSVQPEDIAILLRAAKSDAACYVAALQRLDISAAFDGDRNLLDTVELEAVAAALQIVDNPHQDIPLLTALTSPIFAISNDLLAQVHARHGKLNLFDAICAEAAQEPQLAAFLQTLRTLQQQSCLLKLHEFFQFMEQELGLRRLFGAMPQGPQRLKNLNAFCDLVSNFSANGERTLSQFVLRLADMKAQGVQVGLEGPAESSVTVTTIHKSKGLEYPVVVLAGLSKQFNQRDVSQGVLVHPQMGVACDGVDVQRRLRYPTASKRAIAEQLRRETVSEELRVLYVAMTRPKHRLIMTYCEHNVTATLNKLSSALRFSSPQDAAAEAGGLGDWVLLTALRRTEAGELFAQTEQPPQAEVSAIPWKICYIDAPEQTQSAPVAQHQRREPVRFPPADQLRAQLNFQYPHARATVLPTKVTATQLKGRALDAESAEEAENIQKTVHFSFEKPNFSAQQRGLTPAQRGTATHLAMQFIRYANCTSLVHLQAELERLRAERFLTPQQVEAVDAQALWKFFSSELGQEVLSAKRVVREFKFSVLADGSLLSPEAAGEQVLLQGVTDCCVLSPDGITVLDFKTDRIQAGGEQKAAAFYAGQMNAYSMALSRIFQLPVKRRVLYFFATGTWAEV